MRNCLARHLKYALSGFWVVVVAEVEAERSVSCQAAIGSMICLAKAEGSNCTQLHTVPSFP
jgi:hypothetical protein